MEGIFFGGSMVAAFVAGAVALFAPCCIAFMFPSYLAVAVRNRRWRLLPLTGIFTLGLGVVLVPITLGVSALSRSLLQFHGALYVAGGVLLLVLAGLAVTGRSWSLPMLKSAPDLARTDAGGVFALGVFSGAASACCAPVLAGVMTLSAVSPSLLQATALGVAYVFGMVFPLVVLTALWDRARLGERPRLRGRTMRWSFAGRRFVTTTVDLVAAAMFGVMAIVLFIIARTGSASSEFQVQIASWLQERLAPVVAFLEPIPDWVTGVVLLALAAGAITLAGRHRPIDAIAQAEEACHETKPDQPAVKEMR